MRQLNIQNEMDKLRQMTDLAIDYSDISETDESWLASATLALELVPAGGMLINAGLKPAAYGHTSQRISVPN